MAFLVNYSGLLIYDGSLSTYTIRNIGFKFIRDRTKSKKDSDRKFRKRENDRSHVISGTALSRKFIGIGATPLAKKDKYYKDFYHIEFIDFLTYEIS